MADILLAIDPNHEESWQKALPEAIREARSRPATLHVMAVVPDFGMTMVRDYFPPDFEKNALRDAHTRLTAFAKEKIPGDVTWKADIGHGDIDREILRVAAKIGAELIVMASHGPGERRSFIVGSHADHVVHRSPVSVLVVRS